MPLLVYEELTWLTHRELSFVIISRDDGKGMMVVGGRRKKMFEIFHVENST